jgi:hypothetical protein
VTFDDVLDQVREWRGTDLAVVLWLSEFGPGTDDPIEGVDQPVHYVRFDSGNGFALERTWFRSAQWTTAGGERSLDVNFGAVTVSMKQL